MSESGDNSTAIFMTDDDGNAEEILTFCPNGDVFCHGRFVVNDQEFVEELRAWILTLNLSSGVYSDRDPESMN